MSGYIESLVNLFKTLFILLLFVNVRMYNVFPRFIFIYIYIYIKIDEDITEEEALLFLFYEGVVKDKNVRQSVKAKIFG